MGRVHKKMGLDGFDGFDGSGGGWLLTLVPEPDEDLRAKVVAVTPLVACIMEPIKPQCDLAVSWPWVFQFGSRVNDDYGIFGFGTYCGPLNPRDRVKSDIPLREDEVENHYFYILSGDPLLDYAVERIGENDVLSPINDGTYPLF